MGGFLLTVLISLAFGLIGGLIYKSQVPGKYWDFIPPSIVGAWIGAYMPYFNKIGPKVLDIAIIPALIGAGLFTFFTLVFRGLAQKYS